MVFEKIASNSANVLSDAVNVFEIPPTQVAFSSSQQREILTLNPVNSTPWHFKIHSSSSFIDLSKCYLLTEMRVRKVNPETRELSNIVEADNVAPINMIGATFVKNLKISINNKEISDSNSLQHYRSYLDANLSFSEGAKRMHLTAAGFSTDTVVNTSFERRKKWCAGSQLVQYVSKLDADLFNQPLFLIPHVELDVEVTPNDDKLLIESRSEGNNEYKLEITNIRLFIKTVELMDSLSLEFNQRLEKTPATYALRKTQLKSLFISAGRTEFNANLVPDIVPRRVTLALVTNGAFKGDFKSDPFSFQPFNVTDIGLEAMGRQFPNVPYNLDYGNNQYIRAYYDMLEATGVANTALDNGINRDMFATGGHTIYSFILTNSQESDSTFELVRNGSTGVHIRFKEPVPAGGLMLIAYLEHDSILMIDKNRALTSDHSV